MSKKVYDAVIAHSTYTNSSGEEKTKWVNVGAVIQTEKGFVMLLDRTFNPAGMPDPDGRGNVLINLFEPRQNGGDEPAPVKPHPSAGTSDDIPF